jgi:hypothetical protein
MTEKLKEEIRKLKESQSFYMDKFNQKYKHLVEAGYDGLEFENKQVIEFLDTLKCLKLKLNLVFVDFILTYQ